MLNLNKFCSLFIGLILSVVCALPLSARDICLLYTSDAADD